MKGNNQKGKMICRMCGKEVDEGGITFIEVDYGICKECLTEINEDIEREMERE